MRVPSMDSSVDSTQPRKEDRSIEITPTKTLRENNRTKQNIQELWDNIKGSNILVTGITEIREWNKKYLKRYQLKIFQN